MSADAVFVGVFQGQDATSALYYYFRSNDGMWVGEVCGSNIDGLMSEKMRIEFANVAVVLSLPWLTIPARCWRGN